VVGADWNTGGVGSTPTNPIGLVAHMRALGDHGSLPFEAGEDLAGASDGRKASTGPSMSAVAWSDDGDACGKVQSYGSAWVC